VTYPLFFIHPWVQGQPHLEFVPLHSTPDSSWNFHSISMLQIFNYHSTRFRVLQFIEEEVATTKFSTIVWYLVPGMES